MPEDPKSERDEDVTGRGEDDDRDVRDVKEDAEIEDAEDADKKEDVGEDAGEA